MGSLLSLEEDQLKRISKQLHDPDKAIHLIFRLLGPEFQRNFSQTLELEKVPQVFIHGNPHIDNYARTFTGSGMIDFDRSRIGPYAWDIVRFLASLSLRSLQQKKEKLLSASVVEAFMDGYLARFDNPDLYYPVPSFVKMMTPTKEELTTKSYLASNLKWAKKMRKHPLEVDSEKICKLLQLYLKTRKEEGLLEHYFIEEAGEHEGSLGKNHFLVCLAPLNQETKRDHILIDIKETYQEEDTEWFKTPIDHHGQRMVKASNLYAPGVEQRLSWFSYQKKQYWGREIPSFQAKVKDLLSTNEQEDLAYAVGAQLGRGHRRSARDEAPAVIKKNFLKNIDTFQKVAHLLNKDVILGLDYLVKSQKLANTFFDS